ncbi:MAG TPA: tRNA (guanosine(46)-N7)-methyltransferase TrmB [Candidatus Binatia bacterium]|nr:tRNA (guanosine(46)-N7)-methyltransferase TrmB [Candidatus Binatia bacterium]
MSSAFWEPVFGNDRPVEFEIGPGGGDVLMSFARRRRDTNFFAVEHASGMARGLADRARVCNFTNVRVIAGDARCVVARILPPESVAAYHIYFPDPWPKTRHRERRLFHHGAMAPALARTLTPDGRLHIATDLEPLFQAMARAITIGGFEQVDEAPPARPTTHFERQYGTNGTWAASFRVIRP